MTRRLTALFAALEALLVVGVGIGIPLVPLTLMWALQYGLQLDWIVFWRGAVDTWLLGHGADVRFTLDPAVAASTGIPAAGDPFVVTIAPLGIALITLLLSVRAGRRIAETPHRAIGCAVAVATVAVLSGIVSITAIDTAARPSVWQGTILPTLVFALGIAIGGAARLAGLRRAQGAAVDVPTDLLRPIRERAPRLLAGVTVSVAGGAASALTIIAVAAVVLSVLVGVHYGEIIGLYEGVQSGYLGGAALTIGQLAVLPNLIVFTASWIIGPGFAIGTGSAVSPLGTALGPLPAVPVLGAMPSADSPFAFAWLLIPVLAGFLGGMVVRGRLVRAGVSSIGGLIACGVGFGVSGGVLLGALAWMSSGSAGPGRLADVGPDWLLVGAWAAAEIAVPAVIALLVGGLGRARDVDDATGPIAVQEPARV